MPRTMEGWCNWDTWNLSCMIENDRSMSDYWKERTMEAKYEIEDKHLDEANGNHSEAHAHKVSELLFNWHWEALEGEEESSSTIRGSVIHAAFATTNHLDIARHFVVRYEEVSKDV